MRGRVLGPILGVITVTGVAVASLAVNELNASDGGAQREARPAAVSASSEEFFCPSADEIYAHWEAQGEELKPDAECPDLEPASTASPSVKGRSDGHKHKPGAESHDHDAEDAGEPVKISTLAQAQAVLDPENDPLVFIGKDESGFIAIHVTLAPGQQPPPAWVKTETQFAEWLDNGGAKR